MVIPFIGLVEALSLVALGLGYVVCYLASREEKGLKTTGYIVGTFIIVLSVLLILDTLIGAKKFCKMDMGKIQHHMMDSSLQMPMKAIPPQD